MLEAGVLIDLDGNVLFEHTPQGRSVAYLPDSQDLWSAIWESRDRVRGFAHSHPRGGSPTPSHTDVTTFHAIELGLGKKLDWWVWDEEFVPDPAPTGGTATCEVVSGFLVQAAQEYLKTGSRVGLMVQPTSVIRV